MRLMRNLAVIFSVATLFLSVVFPSTASAEAKWTPIGENEYIYGYTSYKYSCWSGVTEKNPPVIEVLNNGGWLKVATGQILPIGSDIKSPCEAAYPIAVGFVWSVLAPAPPAYKTNRYTATYRQRIPDTEIVTPVMVMKEAYEKQEICCVTKFSTKKIPYIAKVKKSGKYVNVIKYKTVTTSTDETYFEDVLVEVAEVEERRTSIPGWVGEPGTVYIYSSAGAMQSEAFDLARGVLCAFGFSGDCKK